MKKENTSVKKVPNLRFSGFSNEWESVRLGEIVEFQSGFAFKSEYFTEEGIKLVIPKNFTKYGYGNFDNSISKFSNENPPIDYRCTENDLLILLTDLTPSCELLGKPLLVRKEDGEIWLNQRIVRLDTNEKILKKWLLYFLQTEKYHKIIKETATGSTVRHSSNKIISNIVLQCPTFQEQEKTSSFLSLIDSRIHTQNKIIKNLETLIKNVSKKLFSQKIRFKDENGNYYPDWEIKKLGHISTITTGSSNREDSMLEGEYTFFDRSQDIRKSNRYLFDKEAVIIPGEGQEFTPKYFIGKFDLHQRTYAIFDFKEINGKYLYYHLLDNDRHLQSQAVGSTVKSLRLPMFQSMPIKLPCIQEQQKIANVLSSIDSKIEIETNLLNKLEEQKKFLLQNMFV